MANSIPELPGSPSLSTCLNAMPVRFARSTAIVSREVAGETLVVPICKGVGDLDSVYTFNPVGKGLWQLLERGSTVDELAKWVATHYDVDSKQAFADVQSYLAELQKIGLIRAG